MGLYPFTPTAISQMYARTAGQKFSPRSLINRVLKHTLETYGEDLRGGNFPPAMSKQTPEGGRFWDAAKRWSCSEPPWGELVAVNANTGDIAWHVPLGEFPELVAKGIPTTGAPQLGGGITTAGNLIFIGATIDGIFRAFDARNGKELWREKLDAPAHSLPSTYIGQDGHQYVAVPAGGGGYLRSPTSDTVIAFRLQ